MYFDNLINFDTSQSHRQGAEIANLTPQFNNEETSLESEFCDLHTSNFLQIYPCNDRRYFSEHVKELIISTRLYFENVSINGAADTSKVVKRTANFYVYQKEAYRVF